MTDVEEDDEVDKERKESNEDDEKKFSEPQKDETSSSSNSAKSAKRKRDIPSKKCSISNLLVSTICNKTKDVPYDSPKKELCNEDPDFFSWDDEPKIVDKSDHEKFIDELWADFDFLMCSTNIGFYNADKVCLEHDIHLKSSNWLDNYNHQVLPPSLGMFSFCFLIV